MASSLNYIGIYYFCSQHEDFLLALQMNEEQYQKVVKNLTNSFILGIYVMFLYGVSQWQTGSHMIYC